MIKKIEVAAGEPAYYYRGYVAEVTEKGEIKVKLRNSYWRGGVHPTRKAALEAAVEGIEARLKHRQLDIRWVMKCIQKDTDTINNLKTAIRRVRT